MGDIIQSISIIFPDLTQQKSLVQRFILCHLYVISKIEKKSSPLLQPQFQKLLINHLFLINRYDFLEY